MKRPARISLIRWVWILVGTLTMVAQFTVLPAQEEEFSWRGPDGARLPFTSPEEVEDFLKTAQVIDVEGIDKGVTNPRRLLLERNGIRMHAIFRGVDVFKSVLRTPDGIKLDYHDSCRYEYAAYKLSKLLEIGRVPPVVERKLERDDFQDDRDYDKLRDTRKGTVQAWVENAMTEMEQLQA